MIENADLEEGAGCHQALGQSEVVWARIGVPARMIVDEDGPGCRVCDEDPKDLDGVDLAARSTAAGHFSLDARSVLCVDRDY